MFHSDFWNLKKSVIWHKKNVTNDILRQADGKPLQIWSVALTTLLDIPLVPGQDTYKDSGNAKIFDCFEKVPEL